MAGNALRMMNRNLRIRRPGFQHSGLAVKFDKKAGVPVRTYIMIFFRFYHHMLAVAEVDRVSRILCIYIFDHSFEHAKFAPDTRLVLCDLVNLSGMVSAVKTGDSPYFWAVSGMLLFILDLPLKILNLFPCPKKLQMILKMPNRRGLQTGGRRNSIAGQIHDHSSILAVGNASIRSDFLMPLTPSGMPKAIAICRLCAIRNARSIKKAVAAGVGAVSVTTR